MRCPASAAYIGSGILCRCRLTTGPACVTWCSADSMRLGAAALSLAVLDLRAEVSRAHLLCKSSLRDSCLVPSYRTHLYAGTGPCLVAKQMPVAIPNK